MKERKEARSHRSQWTGACLLVYFTCTCFLVSFPRALWLSSLTSIPHSGFAFVSLCFCVLLVYAIFFIKKRICFSSSVPPHQTFLLRADSLTLLTPSHQTPVLCVFCCCPGCVQCPFYGSYSEADPVRIADEGVQQFKQEKYEVRVTAGRE